MSEKAYKSSAQLKKDELDEMQLNGTGYEEASRIPRGMSASEALASIQESIGEEPKELSVDELREQRRNELAKEFSQEHEPSNAMALAFEAAGVER